MNIRLASGTADMALVRSLFEEYAVHLAANPTGAAGISIPNFSEELASLPGPYTALLLEEEAGDPAGCVALKPLTRPGERACEMKRLYIRDRFRNRGLGRVLIEAAIQHARKVEYTAMYLDTVVSAMPQAHHLYTSMHFEQVARYNDNPVADVIFFRLALPPTT